MQYRKIKDTDLTLSAVCLGGGNFGTAQDESADFALLDAFVRGGGNFIDTANVYCRWIPGKGNCSEQLLGKWLKARGAYKDVVIATKGAHYRIDDENKTSRVNRKEIREDLEDSLRALGLDTIDFYWLHRDDPSLPVEEIVEMMEEFVREGRIRYYGFSNYKAARAARAKAYAAEKGWTGPAAVSNQWSMASVNPGRNLNQDPTLVLFDEEEYRWHTESGVPSIPFSSSALGFFEKLDRAGGDPALLAPAMHAAFWNEENLQKYETLCRLRKETGYSLQTLSLAWLIAQPFTVIPVCGARDCGQLGSALQAGDTSLTLADFS